MAGIQAGRLNIEIVAEIARLQSDLDKAKKMVSAASSDIARSAKVANDNIGGMGRTSKLAGYQLQNLSFQANDLFVGLASGQKPMTVFMQQGSQIAQIMSQAGIGVGGLAKEVVGMAGRFAAAHPILLAIGVAAAASAAGLSAFTDQVNDKHKAELDAYAASLGLTAKQIEKAGGAAVTSGDMLRGLWEIIKEAADLEKVFGDLKGWIVDTFMSAALNAKKNVSEIYAAVAAAVDGIKAVWKNIGPILGDGVIAGANIAISAIEKLINGAIDAINKLLPAISPILAAAKQVLGLGDISHVSLGRISNPYANAGASAATAFASSYQSHLKQAESGFDAFFEKWGEAGVKARNDRLLGQVEKDAEKSGKAAGQKAGKAAADEIDAALLALMQKWKQWGLTERMIVPVSPTVDVMAITSALQKMQDDAAKLKQNGIDALNASVNDLIDSLQRLGGFGDVLGGLLGIASGNFGNLGRGPIGQLLESVLKMPGEDNKPLGDTLKADLESLFTHIFGQNGLFGQTLTQSLHNAGLGYAASSAVLGNTGTAGAIGSSVGGILGETFGKKFLTTGLNSIVKGLGDFAGPIGSAIVGVVGGLVGRLFSSAKYGYSSSTGGVGGNNADAQSAAQQLGDSVKSGLQAIADQLGVSLGSYSVSEGVTDGKYRYSSTGRTGELKSGYSDVTVTGTGDAGAQAAVTGAIAAAIKQGALQGLSATEQAFLLKAGDLNAALNEVLDFHATLDAITAAISPFEASLTALQKTFEQQTKTFLDLGATTEQLTQLQAYQQQQLDALVASASSQYLSTFGTSAQQVAAAKKQISDTLTPLGHGDVTTVKQYTALVNATDALADPELYGALMSLVDAFGTLKQASDDAAAAAAAQAAQQAQIDQQKADLQVQLLQAQGKAEEAVALQRKTALAGMDASLRSLQQQVWQAQDIAQAKDDLSQAYDRESSALQSTIDAAKSLSSSLRDVRAGIYDTSDAASDYASLLAKLRQVGSMAGMGDQTAAGQLGGVIQDFLPAAKANAKTMLDYQRAQALAARYADSAISAQDQAVNLAQQQLDQMTATVKGLGAIDDSVITVEQAIERLIGLQGGGTPNDPGAGMQAGDDKADKRQQRLEDILDRIYKAMEQNAVSSNALARFFKNTEHKGWLGVSLVNDETADA